MASGRGLVFVGTLNRKLVYFPAANGPGIGVFAYDEATGELTTLHEVGGIDNPGYLVLNAAGDRLYAVSEVFGWHEGVVTAYRIDRATGALTYINKQATCGATSPSMSAWMQRTVAFRRQLPPRPGRRSPAAGGCRVSGGTGWRHRRAGGDRGAPGQRPERRAPGNAAPALRRAQPRQSPRPSPRSRHRPRC